MRQQGDKSTPVGEKVVLSAANGWKHTFESLPATVDDEPVSYTVQEDSVEGYTSQVKVADAGSVFEVTVTNTREPEPTPDPTPEPTPEPTPDPTPEPTPEPTPDPTPEPAPEPTPEPTPELGEEPTPEPTPEKPGVPEKGLPRTGVEVAGFLAIATTLLGVGLFLRRRPRKQ